MNKYFVSVARGSDSNDGLSPTTPWKTVGKAIGASPGASLGSDGATVYVEPGAYYETVALGLSPNASKPLLVVADRDGAGFQEGGYATPATGVVEWLAWSDDSTPLAAACLSATAKSYVSIAGFKFQSGTAGCLSMGGASTYWTVTDSIFVGRRGTQIVLPDSGTTQNMTIERCDFIGYNVVAIFVAGRDVGYEASLGVTIRNCRFHGSRISISRIGTPTSYLSSGITIEHCFFYNVTQAISCSYPATITLTNPIVIRGCVFTGDAGLVFATAGHVAEDWNDFDCATPRSGVTAGANSRDSIRIALDYGDGRLYGVPLRPHGTPTPGSPQSGRVPSTAYAVPATDATGRSRPEGFGSIAAAVGPLERHDTGKPNAAYADAGSSACLALTGPASLERPILVDATPTTISVKVRWDGDHGDANKPRAVLLANPEIGVVSDQVLTATSSGGSGATPNAYETLTFAAFTPARAGALMLRLVSRSAAGNGVAYFDSITLS